MKLSLLMTALALTSVAASGDTASWGTEKDFASVLADVSLGGSAEDDRAYNCNTAPPDAKCYRKGYPACCDDGTCPEKKPPCECDGDCVPCTWPTEGECGRGQFCMLPAGDCRLMSATIPGTCAKMPKKCTTEYVPVCGCDGKTYGNACAAQGAGVSVVSTGECRNRRPPAGSSYCTYSPNKSCYEDGWPKCCMGAEQPCPSEQPRCDVMLIGGDYCALPPNKQCYSSGWPACCGRFGGTNCPKHKPNCDVEEDANNDLKVKTLRGAMGL